MDDNRIFTEDMPNLTDREREIINLADELKAILAKAVSRFYLRNADTSTDPALLSTGIINALMQELAQNMALGAVASATPPGQILSRIIPALSAQFEMSHDETMKEFATFNAKEEHRGRLH